MLAALFIITVAGVALAGGDAARLEAWMDSHSSLFLTWRLALYWCIGAGWLWMRRRVRAREPGRDTEWRLARAELACVLVVLLLESTQAMKGALA